jgi:type IX secretion system substrate protein
MKTLPFFFTSYLLLLSSLSQAQITFQKTYGGINFDAGWSVQQTSDGGYIITGRTVDFGADTVNVYLIKTDIYGDTLWTKTFGGANADYGQGVQQTSDGGFIIAGYSRSFAAGQDQVYLIKTDNNGNPLWTKTYGGANGDQAFAVQQTTDGGFIIAGYATSFGTGSMGGDIYLIRTDPIGDTLWTKTYGGIYYESAYSVKQTSDSGFIIAGHNSLVMSGNTEIYLVKTDANGNLLWTKTFGGAFYDWARSVLQTSDGGYIITGYTLSFGAGIYDAYLIKTDSNGDSLWTKTYGGTNEDGSYSIQQTSDGGFIMAGYTFSFGAGGSDVYLIKTDINGNLLWTKTFGGTSGDYGFSMQQTTDGGYIIAGLTFSYGAGDGDVYLIKTDSMGNSGCNQAGTSTIVTIPAMQAFNFTTIGFSGATITNPAAIVGSGGTVTTQCMSVGILSAIANSQSGISISPNPSPGNFIITFTNAIDRGEVQIFNPYGSKIFSQNIYNTSNTEIYLKPIPEGIYFVKVWDGEKYFSNKIIIL